VRVVQLEAPLVYDGTQLSTTFFDRHAPGETDAVVLFTGEADVDVEHLVDLEDAEAGAFIWSPRMAHAVLEHRGVDLPEGTWRLHLLGQSELPWDQAATYAQRHFGKGGNVFAEFHLAMLAAAQGNQAGLNGVSQRLQEVAEKGHPAAAIALHWTAALAAVLDGDRRAALENLRRCHAEAARLGGSHAQRTVVDRTIEWLESARH